MPNICTKLYEYTTSTVLGLGVNAIDLGYQAIDSL